MRANAIPMPLARPAAVARRTGIAVLLAALALVGRGVAVTPRTHANPAKIWVINGNVAAATAAVPVGPATFASALTGGAATRAPYLSQFDAFDAASAGQLSTAPSILAGGALFIVVQADGSVTPVSLNGRGIVCTPACDGVTTTTPDAVDDIVVFEVTGNGTRWPGDSFVATALQDAVSLDSRTISVFGQAHNLTLSASRLTIEEGAASCGLGDNTSAPARSAVKMTFVDIGGTPLVGYSADWGTSSASIMAIASPQTTSHLLADGTTVAAPNVICGITPGAATLSARNTWSNEIEGILGYVTRSQTIAVRGIPASMVLTASPALIPCDGVATSTVTAAVSDVNGQPVVNGTTVSFSVAALGTANPVNAPTSGGMASSTITPLNGGEPGVIVTVTAGSVSNQIAIDCMTPGPDSGAHPLQISQMPYSGVLYTAGFTTEQGESLPCGNMGATAWYEFDLPIGVADITVDTAGSSYNTALAVYTTAPMSPPGSLSLLGCNANGASSSVRVIASSPGPYFIQAGGQNGATGWLTLNVRCTNDLDCDGLTDADEASLGTNPGNPDTDGDGLPDGLEVHTLHTNPLLADTDGDGCGDRKELFLVPPLSPTDAWDFYSVPSPALFAAPNPLSDVRDNMVSAFDAQAVFAYYKAGAKAGILVYEQDLNANGIKDGIEYDRTVLGPGVIGPPDGFIGAAEAQAAFAQYKKGYHC